LGARTPISARASPRATPTCTTSSAYSRLDAARTGLDDHEADRRLAQDRRNAGLDPGRLGKHAVAALGAVGAHGDELEPFVACFERANSRRTDADDVPLPEVMQGVVQPDTARSADDDVRVLLLAVAVRLRRTDVGV